MDLTADLGDSRTFAIPLRWRGGPFVPGDAWNLIWTLKASKNDTDAQAKIQKTASAGITSSGSTASVSLIHEDTAGGIINEGELDEVTLVALAAGTYYWDIQAQRIAEPHDVRTVAKGGFELTRDITRDTTNTLPIFTTTAAAPIQVPVAGESAYDIYVRTTEDDPVLTEEQWLASLQGEDGAGGGSNIVIQTTPPDDLTATWIDPEGWLESVWSAQALAWVSKDAEPSAVGYLTWGVYALQWTSVDGGTPYNLVWTPTV